MLVVRRCSLGEGCKPRRAVLPRPVTGSCEAWMAMLSCAVRCGAVRCCAVLAGAGVPVSNPTKPCRCLRRPPTLPGATRPGSQIPRPCAPSFFKRSAICCPQALPRVTAVDLPRPCPTQHTVHRSVGQRALAQRRSPSTRAAVYFHHGNAHGCLQSQPWLC